MLRSHRLKDEMSENLVSSVMIGSASNSMEETRHGTGEVEEEEMRGDDEAQQCSTWP